MKAILPIALAAAALTFGACGSNDETSTAGDDVSTDLSFSLDTDGPGGAQPQDATLQCPGGDAGACAAIDALPDDPAAEVPANTACTQVYGGPTTLTVEGTLRGENVSAVLDRTDGCQIERFDRFTDVLTAVYPEYDPTGGVDVN